MQKVRQLVGMALVILSLVTLVLSLGSARSSELGAVCGLVLVFGLVVAVWRFDAFVWSCCLFSLGVYLAAPFLWMWTPDYFFSRSFDFLVLACLVGSLVLLSIRFAVIPVLWPKIFRHVSEHALTLEDLAPSKGKTVEELRQGLSTPRVNFLFGQADAALVEKWGKIAQTIALLSKSRKRLTAYVVLPLLLWPVAVFFLSGGYDGALDRDLDRMWETVPIGNGMVAASSEAMNAARRVFKNDRVFRGLTMNQAREWLRTDRKNPAFKLGKPRYDFEKDETVLVLSDGRDSIRLVAVCNDAGQIIRSWPEEYMTLKVRDMEQD